MIRKSNGVSFQKCFLCEVQQSGSITRGVGTQLKYSRKWIDTTIL